MGFVDGSNEQLPSEPVNFMGPQQGIPFLNSEPHRKPEAIESVENKVG